MDADLIKLVNKLQDTFANLGGELDMPQLAVVGSQSAGKSSVLETIVGRDFLPRGSGIVTRRPLVLQLIHTPASDPPKDIEEWGQFLHIDKRYTDFNEIRREIEQETFRVAGQNKGISKLPIHLRIYSPNVLDLTLVDLPGLTKIPVGDQPSDIERQIRSLVLDYISKPNCVILAVSAANVDLANSEALKLARSVDPQGRRTIGVLTKLDLMDAGTNALDILTGRVYPLKLGFIGVNGTRYLAKTLNQVLMNHIRDKLPDMKARLNTLMGQAQQELNSFGDAAIYGDKNQQGALVLRLMTQFARDFVASIEGTSVDISTKELSGGARIYYIFNDVFGTALTSIDATHNLDNQDIRTAIRNSTGPRPSLFVPEIAFDLLVKPQIKLLESPSLRCVELVYEELVKICHNCTSAVAPPERLGPTTEYTQSLIDIQTAYINTNHPAFIQGSAAAAQSMTNPPKPSIPRQHKSIEHHSASIESVNGTSPTDDDESADEPFTNGRSSTIPERSRQGAASAPPIAVPSSGTSSHRHHSPKTHHHASRNVSGASVTGGSGSSPHSGTAKETFLNYFFGQNGPGPLQGATADRGAGGPIVTGRDISGADPSLEAGLMAGKRSMDSNAAYDMKSLGKHIEAASDGSPQLTMREEMETNLIRSLIQSYFNIVRQTIQDLVPKAIMHLLVNNTSQQVQNRLVAALYKPELFGELLNEDEALVAERTRVKALLDAYRDAFKTLSEVTLKST
ncbi:P-loop containing nucleoside triphosphate hydrolase protein [Cerioporus squamosus]|nr:P-loop containing nucleoside triphosphate hydrolase protein [Cerioporus squamosus]